MTKQKLYIQSDNSDNYGEPYFFEMEVVKTTGKTLTYRGAKTGKYKTPEWRQRKTWRISGEAF